MKIILYTLIVETIIIWIISMLLGWKFIDSILLLGIIVFGIHYLYLLIIHQTNNEFNAEKRGWTGQKYGDIVPFSYQLSLVRLGLIIFIIGSFIVTIIAYSSYFF